MTGASKTARLDDMQRQSVDDELRAMSRSADLDGPLRVQRMGPLDLPPLPRGRPARVGDNRLNFDLRTVKTMEDW